MENCISHEKGDGYSIIKFTQPGQKNVLNSNTIKTLLVTIDNIEDDKNSKVAIITGSGNVFSKGQDLHEIVEAYNNNLHYDDLLEEGYNKIILNQAFA